MGWEMVKLGDVAEIVMGQAPKGADTSEEPVGIPLIAGAGDFTATGIKCTKYASKTPRLCKPGDVILSIRATIGTYRIADDKYCIGRGVAAIRPKSESITHEFLPFLLRHMKPQLMRQARGATFLQVSKADIADSPAPLPPLEEQQRIAKILNAALSMTELFQKQLGEVLDLKHNLVHAALVSSTIERVPLQELVTVNPKQRRGIPDETPTTFVAMSDVDERLGLCSHTSGTVGEYKKGYTAFAQDDVLVAKITPCFENGKSAIASIPTELGHGSTEFHVLRVKDTSRTSPEIIWSLMKSKAFLAEGENSMRGSSGHRRVPDWFIKKYPVPVFDKEKTMSLTKQLTSLDQVADHINQKIGLSKELYPSLSSRAFAGEL